jgi:hypothetical protein
MLGSGDRWIVRTTLAALLLGAAALGACRPAEAGRGLLDGRTFAGEIGEKGRSQGEPERISFRQGRLHSEACEAFGFEEGSYSATQSGEEVRFDAETRSPAEGRIEWRGTVQGDVLEGTFTWHKEGKRPLEYWVRGRR